MENMKAGVFIAAARKTLGFEQGFVLDPVDSGGATKYGITQKTLAQFRGSPVSVQDVQDLDEFEAFIIFHKLYWLPCGLSRVKNPDIAIPLFDAAVLFGPSQAVTMAQRALQRAGANVKIDGFAGPVTLESLNSVLPKNFLFHFKAICLEFIKRLVLEKPKLMKFKNGWENRIENLIKN